MAAEETEFDGGAERTITPTAVAVTPSAAGPPCSVQFSDQDPYQERLNKSDIEKVIEKRKGGSSSSDYSDLMVLYTARGRLENRNEDDIFKIPHNCPLPHNVNI